MLRLLLDIHLYAPTPSTWPPIIVGMLIATLGIAVFLREHFSTVSVTFSLLTAATALWLFAIGAVFSTPNPDVALAWARIEHVGVVFIPTLVYCFSLAIINRLGLSRAWVGMCLTISSLFAVILLTSPGFVPGLREFTWGFYPRYGIWSLPFIAYFTGALYVSLRNLFGEYRKAKPGRRKERLRLFILALALGYLGCIDFLPAYGYAVYPTGSWAVLAFLVTCAVAVWRYHLVDITPAFVASSVVNTMPSALIVLDPDMHVSLVNKAACLLFHKTEAQLHHLQLETLLPGIFTPAQIEALERSGPIEGLDIHPIINGEQRSWQIVSMSALQNERHEVLAYVCLVMDLTDHKQKEEEVRFYSKIVDESISERDKAEQERRDTQDRYRLLVNAVKDYAIFMLDPDGYVASWNNGSERIKGYRAEEIIGKHFSLFYPLEDVRNGKPEQHLKRALAEGEVHDEGWRIRKNGTKFWGDMLLTPIWDSTGRLRGFTKVTRDMTEQMQLRAFSFRDELTGLYNRRGFQTLAQQAIFQAQREQKALWVILIDLDGLKPINDNFGHSEGDVALKNTAVALQKTFRQSDIVARIGGDEFVVVAGEEVTDITPLLKRLEDHLKQVNAERRGQYTLSVSCGTYRMDPVQKQPIDEALAIADKALYDQKHLKKHPTRRA